MNWTAIWMDFFGTTSFCGIDMGFWVAMAVVCLIVVLMNAVFWGMKPQKVRAVQSDRIRLASERTGENVTAAHHLPCTF